MTAAALAAFAKRVFLAGHAEGWSGNQQRRDTAHIDAEKGWALYVSNGALAKSVDATIAAPPQAPSDAVIEALREAWNDFEGEHLTDGKGHAPADVYRRCRAAFDAAWPRGREVALAAALAALAAAKEAADVE